MVLCGNRSKHLVKAVLSASGRKECKMLTAVVTSDNKKLVVRIKALKELLRTDLNEKDRKIFACTLKTYEKALLERI